MKPHRHAIILNRGLTPLVFAFALFGCNPIVADFEADNTSPKVDDIIRLHDMSEGDPDTWEWNIHPGLFEYQEGTGPGSQDPVLKFSQAGAYSVSLTASNEKRSDIKTSEDYISVLNNHTPTVEVYSPGLVNNLLGDSPEREVKIYLPPDYFENTSKQYPVIYLLHGYFSDYNTWYVGLENKVEINIEEILNDLIQEEAIEPMIVVSPNSYNRYFGSKYTNSSTAGQWEDFITQDVIQYIDTHFRTIREKESRGIGGHSMGGMGAFKMAMKHPELFGALYAHSPGIMAFESVYWGGRKQSLVKASQLKSLSLTDILSVAVTLEEASCAACAPAYAPNPKAPLFGDFPITESGERIDSTWQQWLMHDPLTMLHTYNNNLKQMRAILFDSGTSDELKGSNTLFSEALSEYGISHTFELYEGDHLNRISARMSSVAFPFFSQHLDHE
ncbi:MAG: alpha/beta hydrolase-fold protein [Bacteroidota bacterium]